MHRHAPCLILYFKNNLQRQRQDRAAKRRLVSYSPLASRYLKAKDKCRLSKLLKKRRKGVKGKISKNLLRARTLASAASISLFWTERAASIIGLVPTPCTAAYKAGLMRKLMRLHRQGRQVVNTAIMSCASRSTVQAPNLRTARKRCAATIRTIEEICERAPQAVAVQDKGLSTMLAELNSKGYPKFGYSQSLSLGLYEECGGCTKDEIEAAESIPFANGTAKALGHLSGESYKVLIGNRPLAMARLGALLEIVKQKWGQHGPVMARPAFGLATLANQLCQWERDERGTLVRDLRVLETAIL